MRFVANSPTIRPVASRTDMRYSAYGGQAGALRMSGYLPET